MVFADEVRPRILNAQNNFSQIGARHNSYCPLCAWSNAHTVALPGSCFAVDVVATHTQLDR